MGAVDRDLLERLYQFAGALEIGDELLRGVARGLHEFFQLRAAQAAVALELGLENLGAPGKARRNREADADRVIDLVRDASDEAAEGGEPLGIDQILLRGIELEQRALGLLLGRAQLVLGLT